MDQHLWINTVRGQLTFSSEEICFQHGALTVGDGHDCGRRTTEPLERGGHAPREETASDPHGPRLSMADGNVRRTGSRGHRSRPSSRLLGDEGPSIVEQGGAVSHSRRASSPTGGARSRREPAQPTSEVDSSMRILDRENPKAAWKRVKANQLARCPLWNSGRTPGFSR